MRRFVCVFAVLILAAIHDVALAGSYTVTTTARQDAVLAYHVDRINADRALHGQPPLSADQLFRQIVAEVFASYRAQFDAATRDTACTNYRALPLTDQAAITAQLGNKSPCP